MLAIIGIECKSCSKQWRIEIPISSNEVESFATVCECGSLIVGNRKNKVRNDLSTEIKLQEMYLTNGSYIIITTDENVAKELALLELE